MPISNGVVYGSCYSTSYPQYNLGTSTSVVFCLLRGLVEKQSGKQPDGALALIRQLFTTDLVKSIKAPAENEEYAEEDKQRFCTLEWLACSQAIYGSPDMLAAVDAASRHDWYRVRTLAGLSLCSLRECEASLAIAGRLLKSTVSPVQMQTVESLRRGNFTPVSIAPMLITALPTSDSSCTSPNGLMDPVRNVSTSGRESLIRNCTYLGLTNEVHDILVAFLSDTNITSGVMSALMDHFVKYPSSEARGRFLALSRSQNSDLAEDVVNDYLLHDGSDESTRAVHARLLDSRMTAHKRAKWIKPLYYRLGATNDIVGDAVHRLAKAETDNYILPGVLAILILRNDTNDWPYIERLFSDTSLRGNLGECFHLLTMPDSAFKEHAEGVLLGLLKRHPRMPGIIVQSIAIPTTNVVMALKGSTKPPNETLTESMILDSPSTDKTLDLTLRAIEYKNNSNKTGAQRTKGWLELIASNTGYGDYVLWCELAKTVGLTDRKELAVKLREMLAENQIGRLTALSLLKACQTTLSQKEEEELAELRIDRSTFGTIPQLDWVKVFSAYLNAPRSTDTQPTMENQGGAR
ncbi:MAG: hypothetical protein C0404_11775 [Verrucomicrobia bacterium]|nr:hypothetical protein [Verrucomicrobiota bacterium]